MLMIADIGNGCRCSTVVLCDRHVVCLFLSLCLWLSLDDHQRSRHRHHGHVVLCGGDQHQLQHVASWTTCLLCSCRSCHGVSILFSVCVVLSRKWRTASSDNRTELHARTHARPFVDQQHVDKASKKRQTTMATMMMVFTLSTPL